MITIFTLNYRSTQIIKTAHKSRQLLYRFLIENNSSINEKMKIQNFIGHLSRQEIGFYCLDIFQMNSAMFFTFITQVFIQYFLIIKFHSKIESKTYGLGVCILPCWHVAALPTLDLLLYVILKVYSSLSMKLQALTEGTTFMTTIFTVNCKVHLISINREQTHSERRFRH